MDDLVAELRKQARICETSKAIGSITKDRCEAAMNEAAARIQALETSLAEAKDRLDHAVQCHEALMTEQRRQAFEEAAKVADQHDDNVQGAYSEGWRDASHSIAQAIRALASDEAKP